MISEEMHHFLFCANLEHETVKVQFQPETVTPALSSGVRWRLTIGLLRAGRVLMVPGRDFVGMAPKTRWKHEDLMRIHVSLKFCRL